MPQEEQKARWRRLEVLVQPLAGGVSGVIVVLVGQPFDTIKGHSLTASLSVLIPEPNTHSEREMHTTDARLYIYTHTVRQQVLRQKAWPAFQQCIRFEGLAGLYKGMHVCMCECNECM